MSGLFWHAYFEVFLKSSKIHPRNTEDPKVGNLPPGLLVYARVSLRILWVWPWPNRLPHGLAWVLYGGVLAGECSLECGLKGLVLPLWFYG